MLSHPLKHFQKESELLPKLFHSFSEYFSLVENPNSSQLKKLSQFLQYLLRIVSISEHHNKFQKMKILLSNDLSSSFLFHEVSEVQQNCDISTVIVIFHFTVLILYKKPEIDKHLGNLLSSDHEFFHYKNHRT